MSTPDAKRLLELLFSGSPGFIELRAIATDGGVSRYFCETTEEALVEVEKRTRKDLNLYVGVATRRTKRNGKKKNLYFARALYVDVDFRKPGDVESLEALLNEFSFPPSLIVASR